jgi:hypothetical protein
MNESAGRFRIAGKKSSNCSLLTPRRTLIRCYKPRLKIRLDRFMMSVSRMLSRRR